MTNKEWKKMVSLAEKIYKHIENKEIVTSVDLSADKPYTFTIEEVEIDEDKIIFQVTYEETGDDFFEIEILKDDDFKGMANDMLLYASVEERIVKVKRKLISNDIKDN